VTTLNRKFQGLALMGFISLTLAYTDANACTPQQPLCFPHGFYVGAFGGGGRSYNINASQQGTAFFPAAAGGPLAVNATNVVDGGVGIGGLNVGYEWQKMSIYAGNMGWNFIPAVELEGYYLGTTLHGFLSNPTPRIPEHDFHDTFPINSGVLLANAVITFAVPETPGIVYPYLGVGVGTSYISIHGANSAQIAPPEPGINHFNSGPNATNWTFATQGKAGLRFNLTCNLRLLAEYRFLYLSGTNYTFGATVYPTHVPTTKWKVHFGSTVYNMGALGLEYLI
jgi:opacity protein-like surface antigen